MPNPRDLQEMTHARPGRQRNFHRSMVAADVESAESKAARTVTEIYGFFNFLSDSITTLN